MHDELVKRLRELQAITEHCGEQSCDECENRELCDKHDNKTLSGTYKEAAYAIEKLSMRIHGDEAAIAGMKREIERMVVADKPRWIPVTERLPDFEGSLLCMRKVAPDLSFQEVLYFEDGEFTYNGVDQLEEGTVTYWMPLPEPPKEE